MAGKELLRLSGFLIIISNGMILHSLFSEISAPVRFVLCEAPVAPRGDMKKRLAQKFGSEFDDYNDEELYG